MKAQESITQENEAELARKEIHGYARVATSKVVIDCILFNRAPYNA